ncbi:MAG: protein Xni [Candidatus Azotimanducaceae bacterium]|jgi:protein Xni
MAQKVLLVDAFNLVRRIFEARGGIAGDEFMLSCRQSLQRSLQEIEPSHGLVVWDSHGVTWRHLLDDRYKANREPTPEVLMSLVPELTRQFSELGILSLMVTDYEADDVIATLAVGIAANQGETVIVSTDKMFFQLLMPGIQIYHHFDRRYVEIAEVRDRFGLEINQLVDYWALSGDNSNNIKGITGIGKKTATALLQEYGSIEAMLQDQSLKKLQADPGQATRCQQLVELKRDVVLGVNLKDYRLTII